MASLLQRTCAWAVLVTFSAAFGLGALASGHAGPDDDAACGQVALASGHPHVQFEAVKQTPPATHCPFCHWQRVVSGADFMPVDAGSDPLRAVNRILPPGPADLRSVALDDCWSRGPPADRS